MYLVWGALIILIILVIYLYYRLVCAERALRITLVGPINDERVKWLNSESSPQNDVQFLEWYLSKQENMCGYRSFYDSPCKYRPYYYYLD